MDIRVRRIYDDKAASDGQRVLVERLWPRGMSKEDAALDLWLKGLAPSSELRRWYGHEAERWPEFKQRYFEELDANTEAVNSLCELAAKGRVTLLFASRETERNSANALRDYMKQKTPCD